MLAKKREENFLHYKKLLGNFWCQNSDTGLVSSFAFGTLVKNRIEVYRHLKENNIESRPLICGNIGRHPFWINKYGVTNLKNADIIHDFGIYLPNHFNLDSDNVEFICQKFLEVAEPYEISYAYQ